MYEHTAESTTTHLLQGEPFHNFDTVQSAVEVMTEPKGLGLSKHKVLVSTVGLVPEIKKFVAAGRAKLAVSLHATTDEVSG